MLVFNSHFCLKCSTLKSYCSIRYFNSSVRFHRSPSTHLSDHLQPSAGVGELFQWAFSISSGKALCFLFKATMEICQGISVSQRRFWGWLQRGWFLHNTILGKIVQHNHTTQMGFSLSSTWIKKNQPNPTQTKPYHRKIFTKYYSALAGLHIFLLLLVNVNAELTTCKNLIWKCREK